MDGPQPSNILRQRIGSLVRSDSASVTDHREVIAGIQSLRRLRVALDDAVDELRHIQRESGRIERIGTAEPSQDTWLDERARHLGAPA